MKYKIFMTLLVMALGSGCSDSDVTQTEIPPLHYSQNGPDLIDICRFNTSGAALLATEVEAAGETLGQALNSDSQTRVLLKAKAAAGKQQLYTDNYLIQVATETGTRTVMARLGTPYESELFALDEAALYALPFRFMVIPSGQSTVHICMVDPSSYLSQFREVSPAVDLKLQEAVNHYKAIIQKAFPSAYFDPRISSEYLIKPENIPPIVELGRFSGTMDEVSTALEKGNLYYNDIPFKSGIDTFGNINGKDDPEDIFILYEDPATRFGIEIRGFVAFSTFKDFRKSSTYDLANMTGTMEFLVQNSLIHIYDLDRRQEYDVNGKKVYQLQIFDGHVDPMLISRGVSYFASVPVSVYLTEATNGMVIVEMQNPLFKFLRYYDDLSPALMSTLRENWNTTTPPNKLLWPDLDVEGFGKFSMDIAQKAVDGAMK